MLRIVGLWTALGLWLSAAARLHAQAAETEVREFTIHVDGKEAGKCVMTMTKDKDGTETLAAQASVRVKILLGAYTFSFHGSEVWKNGRLWQIQAHADDNGKKFDVAGSADGERLRLRANGKEQTIGGDVWTNSYWRLPDARFYNKPISVLETDTGKELNRQLQYVGVAPVTLGGKAQNCYHFRVTGGPSPIDLWYDGQLRLVRQEFSEDGHHTVFHLTSLKRPRP
jgi:hypothetical protein